MRSIIIGALECAGANHRSDEAAQTRALMAELPDDPGLPDCIDFGPPPKGYTLTSVAEGAGGNPDKITFSGPSGVTYTLAQMWAKGIIKGPRDAQR